MLLEFTIWNYRSIREPVTLSLVAGDKRSWSEHPGNLIKVSDDLALCRSALIYGANASGKSTLFSGLMNALFFIDNSTALKPSDKIPVFQPFLLDSESLSTPAGFRLEFIPKNKFRHAYEVGFNAEEIIYEEMSYFQDNRKNLLYRLEKGRKPKWGKSLRGKKDSIQKLPNTLFLSKAASENNDQLRELYEYFHNYYFHDPFYGARHQTVDTILFSNPKLMPMISKLLSLADTGITGLDVVAKNEERVGHPFGVGKSQKELQTFFNHRYYERGELSNFHQSFPSAIESTGTQELYKCSLALLRAISDGGLLALDELNSLHPLLLSEIIAMFNSPETNPNNAQLILITHDTSLMDSSKIRRDQIWFTEKNEQGATELFSLFDFDKNEVRKGGNFDRWYTSGRFGGIPIVRGLGEALADGQKAE